MTQINGVAQPSVRRDAPAWAPPARDVHPNRCSSYRELRREALGGESWEALLTEGCATRRDAPAWAPPPEILIKSMFFLLRVAQPSVRRDAPASGGSWEALGRLSGGSREALGRVLGGSREALGRFWEEKRNKKTLPKQQKLFSFPLLFLPYISK